MALKPVHEGLEDRQLLSASLAPIPNVIVPTQMGYQAPLDGSANLDPSQSYTVTSDNPDIQVSVAQGQFWTLNVEHTASTTPGDISFSGPITFQLFHDLTPQTVAQITQFTNDGYYDGKDFYRIVNGFPGPTDYVVQGGPVNPDGSGMSGLPGTPFANEIVQQLAFTGSGQLAMANAGPNSTNDTQFFVTTGTPTVLDYGYTVFGQVVSGSNILADMTQVATEARPLIDEKSLPVSPIVITSATLSSTNVNGVIHIDTTSAQAGESANIAVTATDPVDGSHVGQNFMVTTSAYNGPTNPPINFKPLANPVSATTGADGAVTIQLDGMIGYPTPSSTQPTGSFVIVTAPGHGQLSQFNALSGTLVYTPDPGFGGVDSFQFEYQATEAPINPTEYGFSNPTTVTITVTPVPPPLVTVSHVSEVFNSHHDVTKILVEFTGPVSSTQALQPSTYRLLLANAMGSFSAKNAHVIQLKKRVYDSSGYTVTLELKAPLSFNKKAELIIFGEPPSGLTDSHGRLIDGDHNGTPGGDATVLLTRSGVILS
jgi:cyclophilin family peptidyl-prolyl cis-trans isomerase